MMNDPLEDSHGETEQQPPPSQPRRRAPGLLRLLPETLPFYSYDSCQKQKNGCHLRTNSRRRRDSYQGRVPSNAEDLADRDEINVIPIHPLQNIKSCGQNSTENGAEFTLFFFVDSTNRQSLLAMPKVSCWFHNVLEDGRDESTGNNRVICIPNHPSPNEISFRDSNSDPIIQASINSSVTSIAKQQIMPMLRGSGFYHLPYLHARRLPLLHLLGATRVPSIIVVSNDTGRIVTRYGWEAIDRDGSKLDQWMDRIWIENKKADGDKLSQEKGEDFTSHFESLVVKEWSNGKSGLPFWWHLLSWII